MKRLLVPLVPLVYGMALVLGSAIATSAQTPSPQVVATAARTSLILPTHGLLTSTFGWRWGRMHEGIDIGAAQGSPVLAVGRQFN